MACSSCGQRRAASNRPGQSPGNPVVIGNRGNSNPVQYLTASPDAIDGYGQNQYVWVAGDGVQSLVDSGSLQTITNLTANGRVKVVIRLGSNGRYAVPGRDGRIRFYQDVKTAEAYAKAMNYDYEIA